MGIPGPFGDLRSVNGWGLKPKYIYEQLIKNAFADKYWKAPGLYKITNNGQLTLSRTGYSQMEYNFSMFWGISIMLYEATLVSDQSEFDTLTGPGGSIVAAFIAGCFPAGPPGTPVPAGIDPLWLRGCNLFFAANFGPPPAPGRVTAAGCVLCHYGPLFSENAVVAGTPFTPFLPPVPDVNNVLDMRGLGFASIGIRPPFTDLNLGGEDPYGNPLSFGRQYKQYKAGGNDRTRIRDLFLLNAIDTGTVDPSIVSGAVSKLEVDGATKIPTMRNIALTPPYFSWGGYPNLGQVLKTYNRGLDRRDIHSLNDPNQAIGTTCTNGDNSGTGPDGHQQYPMPGVTDCNTNTTGVIVALGLSDCEAPDGTLPKTACTAQGATTANDDLAALVRFLKSLTDPRVQCDQAPFDHPSLFVFNGSFPTDLNHDGLADDIVFLLPEIGAGGYDPSSGYCIPNAGDLFAPGMQARSGGKLNK